MFSAVEIIGIALFTLVVVGIGIFLYRLDNAMTNAPFTDDASLHADEEEASTPSSPRTRETRHTKRPNRP